MRWLLLVLVLLLSLVTASNATARSVEQALLNRHRTLVRRDSSASHHHFHHESSANSPADGRSSSVQHDRAVTQSDAAIALSTMKPAPNPSWTERLMDTLRNIAGGLPEAEAQTTAQDSACTLPRSFKTFSFQREDVTVPFDNGKPISYMRWGDGDFDCAFKLEVDKDSNGVDLENSSLCDQLFDDLTDYGRTSGDNLWIVSGNWWTCEENNPRIHHGLAAFFTIGLAQPNWRGFANGWSAGGFYFPLLPEKDPHRKRGILPRLQGRSVSVVGPKHLTRLSSMLGYSSFLDVPERGLWDVRDRVFAHVQKVSSQHPDASVVFIIAGGVAARPIIYRLYKEFGQKDSFIDVGASLDGFAGVQSRDFNSNLKSFCHNYPEYVVEGLCRDLAILPPSSFIPKWYFGV